MSLVRTHAVLLTTLGALWATTSTTGTANAQSAPQTAPSIELVEVFAETGQALVYDAHEREYALLKKGSPLRDFEVAQVSARQIELFRPAAPSRRYVVRQPRLRPVKAPTRTTVKAPQPDGPLNPYGTPKPPEPIAPPPPEPVKSVKAPVASQPIERPARAIVTRRELNKSLDDLEALSREVELALVPGGVRVISIGTGSLPYRLGLRKDDIVRRVAGVPTTRLEDGADVFVKLARVRSFTIDVERDKRAVSLPVAVISNQRAKQPAK